MLESIVGRMLRFTSLQRITRHHGNKRKGEWRQRTNENNLLRRTGTRYLQIDHSFQLLPGFHNNKQSVNNI